jgi:hypothetical protein
VGAIRPSTPRQLARLIDELADVGLDLDGGEPWHPLAVAELDYAMRPSVHERRVPSVGAIIEPEAPVDDWEGATELTIERRPIGERSTDGARRYADGMSSWLMRRVDHRDEWLVFDRPAGSERDLVVLAEALRGVVIQRHPAGLVRVVGSFGVFRWNGREWQHQPLVSSWIDTVNACSLFGDRDVLQTLLEFAVHDLGARDIGAVLVYRPDRTLETSFDQRLALPPALHITHAADLAPLRHVLSQVDGAALFDDGGTLREIGVRLVPSSAAEVEVEGLRGTRHTSARRYSYDDPTATVIAVSEDGPVTVFRGGEILGASGSA